MNQLEQAISDICNTYRLREKILIVPCFSQGHQITESLVKNGNSYINLRINTLSSLAHEVVALDLVKESITILPETSILIIIEDLFTEIRERNDSYFHNLEPKEGMVDALVGALMELRMNGISFDELLPEHFLSKKKSNDIKELLNKYESLLKENHYADKPEIMRRSVEKLKIEKSNPNDKLYLFLSDTHYTALEKEFIEALPGEKIVLPHDKVKGFAFPQRYLESTAKVEDLKVTSNIERLPWLFNPEDAPTGFEDSTVQIFHAVGRRNEVREVLRRIVSSGIKSDEVEIIYTSYDDYVSLIYDMARKFDINLTVEEGLPVTITRPGKAALGFLSWVSSNYEAVKFKQLMTGGSLTIKPDEKADDRISPTLMARILRESPIGWGKERYISTLEKMAESYKSSASEIDEDREDRSDFYKRKEANARFLISMLKPILDAIPEKDEKGDVSLKDLCIRVLDFVLQYARVSNELDGEAKSAIRERLEEIQGMTTKSLPFSDAIDQVDLVLRGIRIGHSGPAPGCLHISSYLNGGRSGREHTYVVGCDAQTFPGTIIQNPILLDEELQAIDRNLVVSSEILKEKLYRIASLLSSLRGYLTLSFSSFDILENRESFPSSILLQIHRLISGNFNANYTDLMNVLGLPSGYIPSKMPLDISDFWITSFIGEHGLKQPDPSVFACYPGLSQGQMAKEARETNSVTEYDGKLLMPDRGLDPRENADLVMSASMLEKIATCPYAYFLNYILRVRPLEEVTFEEDTWLNAMQRGSLLHDLFNRFMREITGKGEKPSFKKHLPLIESTLKQVIKEYRDKIPPPSEAIFEQEKKILIKAAQVFLKTEENRCKTCTPLLFEFPFGYKDAGAEFRDPVRIPLGAGKSFLLAGRIDRIDKIAEHEYAVLDYKTGSAYAYKDHLCFNKGKALQHALYAIAAETILKKTEKSGKGVVKKSGYLFPTEKETGRLVIPDRNDEELIALLNDLLNIVKKGVFIPSDEEDACKYCDYTNLCGESVIKDAKRKFENAENKEIDPFRAIKEYE
jgi:RecB family exonuclease